MTVTVRRATTADAAGIAAVHVQAWRETYTRILPTGALDDLDPTARAEVWTGIIDDGRTDVVVAERDGTIVGWASSSAGRDAGAAIGDRPAYLWSAVDNPRARAFYERHGFAPDGGRHAYPLAGHPIEIERFVR